MPGRGWSGRRITPTAAVLLVVLIGLGFRLHAAWTVNSLQPNAPSRLSADEPGYDNLARGLLAGEGLTWPGRVPGYPAWLAALYWVTGGSYNEVLYVQAVVGALTVWLTYLLGRRLFGHAPGLVAALGVALHFVLIQQSVRYLSEVLFTPAVLIVVLALARAVEWGSTGRFALVGLAVGAANLVRPTLFLFPLFLLIVLPLILPWRRALRAGAVVVVISALVIMPWMVRNFLRYDAVLPLATSNAILWQGSPEYYRLIRHDRYTYLQVWNEVIYGPGGEGHDPGTVEGERYWNRRAVRSIRAEPHIYALFFIEKLGTYWVGDPNADWGDTFVFNFRALRKWEFTRAQTAQIMAVRALPIVALVAIVVLRRRWPELLPVLAILAYCTLLHAATHAEARLSDPLQPLLLVLIAGAWLRRHPAAVSVNWWKSKAHPHRIAPAGATPGPSRRGWSRRSAGRDHQPRPRAANPSNPEAGSSNVPPSAESSRIRRGRCGRWCGRAWRATQTPGCHRRTPRSRAGHRPAA